ncbi:MAG: glycosyltransferase family 2 protein [Bacteroidales bacterium]|jgi:glycosyltransferase involved in cell wall biosynthesis|nr:glycosyltransferase family 2 protein [Bacteroidales bacterium]MDD2204144.1 glycosyltransferase family 2 protein [Bacteroidales bacterium]MDD3151790.1 glycosyltransferase family 2 protein [Bacteroidales bacterium]MDD3913808.1 glycosyltransferase family 2 protein [Bacteroidales bacterium]MDD4633573.1 glycosyltransferase family 2 protein [Bacteroidales bacterium]
MKEHDICVIIPTYNNSTTIEKVIVSVLQYCPDVIVVNDGSTDATSDIVQNIPNITLISYEKNCGKGYALCQGFKAATDRGFRYAITIDSDGQHLASDIPAFVYLIENNPDAMLIGSRQLGCDGMPKKNTFANKFSNFWFTLQTGEKLPDTQTGFRLYPLRKMGKMRLVTKRYEAELELLVRCAWRGIAIVPLNINVFYPDAENRVSHFRPARDFARISILNTCFCLLAVVYGYPAMLVHYIKRHLL